MDGVHQPLQEPELTCHDAFQDKSGIDPFLTSERNTVKSRQEIVFLCNRTSLLNTAHTPCSQLCYGGI